MDALRLVNYEVTARNTSRDHAGSIHDDTAAKAFGYSGGLVPGVVLYCYMSHPVVEIWGLDWVHRGTMESRSIRPVYEGQHVTVTEVPTVQIGDDPVFAMQVNAEGGRPAAIGRATMPTTPPETRDSIEPLLPLPENPPLAVPGAITPGHRFGSSDWELSLDELEQYLADVDERYPGYRQEGIFPPAYLQRVTTRWERASFQYRTPTIYVEGWTRHLRGVCVGDRLRGNGVVTNVFERRGNHYMDVEQVVVANDTDLVAISRRRSVYCARQDSGR